MYLRKEIIGIIDDDVEVRDSLALLLSSFWYQTELFTSAEEFIRAVNTTRSTCLVVDIELGDITGVELACKLSAMGHTFPIIFITGSCDATNQRKALDFGCVALLHKPFPAEQLIESIAKAARRL